MSQGTSELERHFLHLLFQTKAPPPEILCRLRPGDFQFPLYREVYCAATGVVGQGKPVEIGTILEHLEENGRLDAVGGSVAFRRLSEIAEIIPPGATDIPTISSIASLLLERGVLNELLTKACAHSREIREAVDFATARLGRATIDLDLEENGARAPMRSMKKVVEEAFRDFESRSFAGDPTSGQDQFSLRSSLPRLDFLTGGFRPGTLSLVSGESESGKTSFMALLAMQAVIEENRGTMLFLPEESARRFTRRMLLQEKCHGDREIVTGQEHIDLLERVWTNAGYLQATTLLNFRDNDRLTYGEIIEEVQLAKSRSSENPVWVILIDGLHRVLKNKSPISYFSDTEIPRIANSLRRMARDFDLIIVASITLCETSSRKGNVASSDRISFEYPGLLREADNVLFFEDHQYTMENRSNLRIDVQKSQKNLLGASNVVFQSLTGRFSEI